jgi:hypothetical protein
VARHKDATAQRAVSEGHGQPRCHTIERKSLRDSSAGGWLALRLLSFGRGMATGLTAEGYRRRVVVNCSPHDEHRHVVLAVISLASVPTLLELHDGQIGRDEAWAGMPVNLSANARAMLFSTAQGLFVASSPDTHYMSTFASHHFASDPLLGLTERRDVDIHPHARLQAVRCEDRPDRVCGLVFEQDRATGRSLYGGEARVRDERSCWSEHVAAFVPLVVGSALVIGTADS